MSALSAEFQDLIKRIVAIHGEEGVCRTADEWALIMGLAADKPVRLINLLKFRETVRTEAGDIPGWKAYNQYMTSVQSAFTRAGGKRLFFGKISHIFPGHPGAEWDAVISTQYPNPRALADFWLDEEFIEAHSHRVEGVERGQVILLEAN